MAWQPITLRLTIQDPVPGLAYRLPAKKSQPVDPKTSVGGEAIAFDFSVRIAPGPKFYGEQVRSEGPARRFVYVAIGGQAGDAASPWSRRMKIDIHDIPQPLLDAAANGRRLVGTVIGTGEDGTPACATLKASWRAG